MHSPADDAVNDAAEQWHPTRLSVASWITYDLANTIFALGVGSLYFAEWLTDSAADLPSWFQRFDEPADLALAITLDIAMVIVIVLGPWIGARSDHRGRRIPYLAPMTLLAVVPTFFIATGGVTASLGLFVIALVGFNLGSVVYDALLPDVSTPETVGRVSGRMEDPPLHHTRVTGQADRERGAASAKSAWDDPPGELVEVGSPGRDTTSEKVSSGTTPAALAGPPTFVECPHPGLPHGQTVTI